MALDYDAPLVKDTWEPWLDAKADRGPRRLLTELTAPHLAETGKGRITVDCGAGNGHEALWLAERGFNVMAADSSPRALGYLERLEAYTMNLGGGIVHAVPKDFRNMSMQDICMLKIAEADLVFDGNCLTYLPPAVYGRTHRMITASMKPGALYTTAMIGVDTNHKDGSAKQSLSSAIDLFEGFEILDLRQEHTIMGERPHQRIDHAVFLVARKLG